MCSIGDAEGRGGSVLRCSWLQTGCYFTLCKIHQNEGSSVSDPEVWWHQHMERLCVPHWKQDSQVFLSDRAHALTSLPSISQVTPWKNSAMLRRIGNCRNSVLLVPNRHISFFLSAPKSEMGNYERHLSKKGKLPVFFFLFVCFCSLFCRWLPF